MIYCYFSKYNSKNMYEQTYNSFNEKIVYKLLVLVNVAVARSEEKKTYYLRYHVSTADWMYYWESMGRNQPEKNISDFLISVLTLVVI